MRVCKVISVQEMTSWESSALLVIFSFHFNIFVLMDESFVLFSGSENWRTFYFRFVSALQQHNFKTMARAACIFTICL